MIHSEGCSSVPGWLLFESPSFSCSEVCCVVAGPDFSSSLKKLLSSQGDDLASDFGSSLTAEAYSSSQDDLIVEIKN